MIGTSAARPPLAKSPNAVEIFSAADFGVPEPDPFGVSRVPLVDNTIYRCHGTIQLPRLWLPKAAAPGVATLVTLIGYDNAALLVDGDDIPHIWGRDTSALGIERVSFVDISNSGAGRGSVLLDVVGGNGQLSFISMSKCALTNFKREAAVVDMAVDVSSSTQSVGFEQGWIVRVNTGLVLSQFFTGRQFTGFSAAPDNLAPAVAFTGSSSRVSISSNGVDLGKEANSFLLIDSGTPQGSFSIVGQNWSGVGAGNFFRPDEVGTLVSQIDASVAVASFSDSTTAPGVDTTVSFASAIDVVRGQTIVISGGTYAGTYSIVRVADDQTSFDFTFVFAGASAGTLALTEHVVSSCKFVRDETVTVSGTTDYNGVFHIVRKTDTSFTLPQVFVSSPQAGTATSTGLDETSFGVSVTANGAQADSQRVGDVHWNGNASATTIQDGTYTTMTLTNFLVSSASQRFVLSNAATGEITYTGESPIVARVRGTFVGMTGPSTENNYRIAISINQAVPAFGAVPYSTISIAATSERATFIATVGLNPGDDFRFMNAGQGTTTSITWTEGQYLIEE